MDFRNVIMIMTSNIGADRIMSSEPFGFIKRDGDMNYQKMKEMLTSELERNFRPEFINRIDEVVVFHKLTHADMLGIVDLELSKVNKRLKERSLALELTTEAKEFLVEKGTDEKFGARPLRRTISSMIEDPLSEDLLRGVFLGAASVTVGVKDNKLTFEAEAVPTAPKAEQSQPASGAKS